MGALNRGQNSLPTSIGLRCVRDATAEPILFNLQLGVNPENAGSVCGEGAYQAGEEVVITASANTGWEFVNWTGDTDYIDNTASSNTFVTMPAENISLTANFQETDEPDGSSIIDIDGNVYQTVNIGEQEWMAENLRVTRYKNGDDIPTGLSNTEWSNTSDGAYAIYNNDDDMLEAYGKLYNWYAVDDSRGLCPDGWSVPNQSDWIQLINYVEDHGFSNYDFFHRAANALKSCRQVSSPFSGDCDTDEHPRWGWNHTHYGFDEFGFSALPGGGRCRNGGFVGKGSVGFWWVSNVTAGGARIQSISSNHGRIFRHQYADFRGGFSVRCIKNSE